MQSGSPLRVVFYAVNGTGVGHLTRLLAIARWLRRYAAVLERSLEVWFLTSSEADSLVFAEGFAAFKIPSKTIVAEAGIDRRAYVALAKQWVWHTLGLLRPDLLVVDTFPRGSFGELIGALDLCKRAAFVYRPVRPEVAARPDFQAMIGLYDLVLVPEARSDVRTPPGTADRVVHVGPVLSRERWELVARDDARSRLGIGSEQAGVFVSAGGGGDRDAEAHLRSTVQALSKHPSIAVVLGMGPLYRGAPFPNVTTLPGRAAEWLLAFDAAVCAAGYNTFGELMFAGVPTAFLPQEKLADDQGRRAKLAVERGAGSLLETTSDIFAVVSELLSRGGARHAARNLVPENGARQAALETLRLICPPSHVDRAESALDDRRLATIHAQGVELEALTLAPKLARGRDAELGSAINAAGKLLTGRSREETLEIRALVDAIARGLPDASTRSRADVCRAALDALAPIARGDGTVARSLVAQRRWGGDGLRDGHSLARAIRESGIGQVSHP